MSHTQNTVAGAIARSISHDEIVTVLVEDIDAAFAELTSDIDDNYDHTDTGGAQPLREVWSTDVEDGNDWRVHLLQRAEG